MTENPEQMHDRVATRAQTRTTHPGTLWEPKPKAHSEAWTVRAEVRDSPEIIGTTDALRVHLETATHGIHRDIARDGGILAVDVYESADEYVVTTMVPGVSRNGVVISCDAHKVTLVALIPDPMVSDGGAGIWRIRELGSGPFVRVIPFASAIVPERVQTRFTEGLLTIQLLKAK